MLPQGSQKASTSHGPRLARHRWYSSSTKRQSSPSCPPRHRDRRSLRTFFTPGMCRAAMSTPCWSARVAIFRASSPRSAVPASSLLMAAAVVMLSVRNSTRQPRHSAPHFSSAFTAVASSRQFEDRAGAASPVPKRRIWRRCCHHAPPANPEASVVHTWIPPSVTSPPAASISSSSSGTSPRQKPESATMFDRYTGREGMSRKRSFQYARLRYTSGCRRTRTPSLHCVRVLCSRTPSVSNASLAR